MKRRRYVVETKRSWDQEWDIDSEFADAQRATARATLLEKHTTLYIQVIDYRSMKDNRIYSPKVVWESD